MTTPENSRLPDTRHSVIADAIQSASNTSERDLTRFCEAYWFPIFATIRRKGYEKHAAEDLTQDLFAKILDPSKNPLARYDPDRLPDHVPRKFRTFILWQIDGHLSDANRKAKAAKRGGNARPIPFDIAEAEARYQELGHESLDPSQLFERLLALEILEKVEAELEFQYQQSGKADLFAAIKPHLYRQDSDESYAALGKRLSMTRDYVRKAVEKMKGANRLIIRSHVARLCTNPAEVDQEIKALQRAL